MPPRRDTRSSAGETEDPPLRELAAAIAAQAEASNRIAQLFQQQNAVHDAPDADLQRLNDFRRAIPPSFQGDLDPDAADNWIQEIERIFEDIPCTDAQKVRFAARLLKEHAYHWWMSKRPLLEVAGVITWDIFKREFLNKYFPRAARAAKEVEFLKLTQGSMTVSEYTARFEALCRYSTTYQLNPDEAWKCARFQEGLKPELHAAIAMHEITNYAEMVNKCLTQEESMKRLASHRQEAYKRKQASQGNQSLQPQRRPFRGPNSTSRFRAPVPSKLSTLLVLPGLRPSSDHQEHPQRTQLLALKGTS